MKVTMTEQQVQNLMLFLDRVEYKGIKETEALNEILEAFKKAVEQDEKDRQLLASKQAKPIKKEK